MTRSLADEGRDLIAYDWLVTTHGGVLHHAEITDPDDLAEIADGGTVEDVRLTCGRRAKSVTIPGVFTRMGAPRCQRCCDRLGYPHGIGSPKNDAEIRVMLGLTA